VLNPYRVGALRSREDTRRAVGDAVEAGGVFDINTGAPLRPKLIIGNALLFFLDFAAGVFRFSKAWIVLAMLLTEAKLLFFGADDGLRFGDFVLSRSDFLSASGLGLTDFFFLMDFFAMRNKRSPRVSKRTDVLMVLDIVYIP